MQIQGKLPREFAKIGTAEKRKNTRYTSHAPSWRQTEKMGEKQVYLLNKLV